MTKRYRYSIAALFLTLLIAGIYFLYIEEQGNFHPITEGEAYRSAQLDSDELEYYVKKYGIRSILNLRGTHIDEAWYREEIKTAANLSVIHYDVSLSASSEPRYEDVSRLMEIIRSAPRPVLIHCMGGADRSGLVAAMWKLTVDKEPKEVAGRQLSILYGHIPIGKTSAMGTISFKRGIRVTLFTDRVIFFLLFKIFGF